MKKKKKEDKKIIISQEPTTLQEAYLTFREWWGVDKINSDKILITFSSTRNYDGDGYYSWKCKIQLKVGGNKEIEKEVIEQEYKIIKSCLLKIGVCQYNNTDRHSEYFVFNFLNKNIQIFNNLNFYEVDNFIEKYK